MHRLSPLCFITPERSERTALEETIRSVLDAGCRWIQLRRKGIARRDFFREAEAIRKLTAGYAAMLVVNDYADIALAVDADGVHLGQDDLPLDAARRLMGDRVIGISTHSLTEAKAAEEGSADYIGFGPIFETATKDAGIPKGAAAIGAVIGAVTIPVVAIGGINPANAHGLAEAGCRFIAVSSGITSGEVTGNVISLLTVFGRA